jgi:hypothetical protein
MKNVNVEVKVNEVKKVDVKTMRQQMMEGYVEMAKINREICNEFVLAENEADNTLVSFLGN